DERPVWPLANQIYMQIRTLSTHRSRRRNQFAKTFLHVHAPDVNDRLRARVNVQLPSRLNSIPDVEDREVTSIDNRAALFRSSAHQHSFLVQVVTDRHQKIGLAQNGARVQGGNAIGDAVDVGSDAHDDNRNG